MKLVQIFEELQLGHKERVHISYNPVESIKDMTNNQSEGIHRKPKGFWYAFGSKWIQYVRNNLTGNVDFGKENRHGYKVYIDTSKVFSINTVEDLNYINENYSMEGDNINWGKFAQDYNGVEIPSIFKLGVEFKGPYSWLSTWDMSSGCIWNPASITKLKKL